jgi:release factor glutamine methyltransferase
MGVKIPLSENKIKPSLVTSLSEVLAVLSCSNANPSLVDIINQSINLLSDTSDSAKLDAQILLALILKKEVSYLLTWPEKRLETQLLEQYAALLFRRIQGEPIAYITGFKEFWSLSLMVSPATLIPRPDTEILVEQALEYVAEQAVKFPAFKNKILHCLDLGTGTGAIALALATEMPHWQIEAVDFNVDAVILANKNQQRLKIKNVTIYQSDWFDQIDSNKTFDIIVSNPPYIDETDQHLTQGDVCYEPTSALVAKQQGLADFIHIATQAKNYLTDGGILFFEHGFEQGVSVQNILRDLAYKNICTGKDLSGNDRITRAIFESNNNK